MSISLAELANKIGAQVHGDESCTVARLATLEKAQQGEIAFLSNSKYKQQLSATHASAVIISEDCLSECPTNALVMDNPYLGYAMVAQLLDTTPKPANSVHASATIADDAIVAESATIGANAVIESGAIVGENVSIGTGCFIGKNAKQ